MDCSHIFKPITIRGMTFENRIIMPSMGTLMTYEDSMVTDRMIDYFVERAKGGAALLFTECASIWPESTQGWALGISDDKFIPGLTRLVEAVHAVGGKIGIQIYEAAEGVMNGHADISKLRIMSPIDKCGANGRPFPPRSCLTSPKPSAKQLTEPTSAASTPLRFTVATTICCTSSCPPISTPARTSTAAAWKTA